MRLCSRPLTESQREALHRYGPESPLIHKSKGLNQSLRLVKDIHTTTYLEVCDLFEAITFPLGGVTRRMWHRFATGV